MLGKHFCLFSNFISDKSKVLDKPTTLECYSVVLSIWFFDSTIWCLMPCSIWKTFHFFVWGAFCVFLIENSLSSLLTLTFLVGLSLTHWKQISGQTNIVISVFPFYHFINRISCWLIGKSPIFLRWKQIHYKQGELLVLTIFLQQ